MQQSREEKGNKCGRRKGGKCKSVGGGGEMKM